MRTKETTHAEILGPQRSLITNSLLLTLSITLSRSLTIVVVTTIRVPRLIIHLEDLGELVPERWAEGVGRLDIGNIWSIERTTRVDLFTGCCIRDTVG